jgi:hypothetical protein
MGIFFFTNASRPALELTQPLIQWATEALSLRIKWPGHEANQSPPSNADVKKAWHFTSAPQYAFMAWCSVKEKQVT